MCCLIRKILIICIYIYMLYFYIICILKESILWNRGINLFCLYKGFYKVFGREGMYKLYLFICDNIFGVILVYGIYDEFLE